MVQFLFRLLQFVLKSALLITALCGVLAAALSYGVYRLLGGRSRRVQVRAFALAQRLRRRDRAWLNLKLGQPARLCCPRCAATLEPETDHTLCPECYADLQHPCPGCGEPVALQRRICPHCGHDLRGAWSDPPR